MEDFKKYEKIIRWIIIVVIAVLLTSTIVSTVKSYQLGRLCNQFRERITDTENSNRRLAETVGKCQSVCEELGDSVDRNIRTAREAVELIEEVRIQVQNLQNCINDSGASYDYEYWDSYFGLQY